MLILIKMYKKILLSLSFILVSLVLITLIQQHLQQHFIDKNPGFAIFDNKIIKIPQDQIADLSTPAILGDNTSNKRIEVDLTSQELKAFENNQQIYTFKISSGKWGRTPTGEFKIWTKFRSAKMSGGSKELGTYYYLPNVPYIMFFYNQQHPKIQGFSLHGTYWHNNFGVPMSHGCINMKTEEATIIFSWAEINTPITIYGKYNYDLSKK